VSTTSITNVQGTNVVIVHTTKMHGNRYEYSWLLLGLLAAALIAGGLRKLFWTSSSN